MTTNTTTTNTTTEGTGADSSDGTAIHPFTVDVPQADLDDLHDRLDRTRWPDALAGVGWDYGVSLDYVRELAAYWRHSYDWRAQETALNRFPQFTTTIDGERVHFIHARSPEPDATPLLITHGWPGSVAEFMQIIDPLIDPVAHGGDPADAFHVVVPSIPGYGFSGPTHTTGWSPDRVAAAFAVLMGRLGYARFGAQGGDWGSAITRTLAGTLPDRVIGAHVNYFANMMPPDDVVAELDDEDRRRLDGLQEYMDRHAGYMHIQSTRPQTLAYGLTDSPVGQLAWIVDTFVTFSAASNVPEDAVDRDQMLTDVMLYWLTGTAGSSARLYREAAASWGQFPRSDVPIGVAVFPGEISPAIRKLAEPQANIAHWTEMPEGGHFAAMEQPELLVDDVRTFFRGLR